MESLLQLAVSWTPTLLGMALRVILYKPIFARNSKCPFVEKSVEFFYANNIKFGSSVYVDANCRLHASNAEIVVGNSTRIMRNSYICTYVSNARQGEGIYIGNKCWVGINSVLSSGQGGIFVGDNVLIGPNVTIVSGEHNFNDYQLPSIEQEYSGNPIFIHENVWIGANAVIVGGVTIGRHAVVAAGAVVTKDVESYTVAGGVPAKLVKRIDKHG